MVMVHHILRGLSEYEAMGLNIIDPSCPRFPLFVWFYLTPIIYPISMIPTGFHTYLYLNPAFPFIELFQQIFLRQTMEPVLLGIATIWTVLSLFLGTFFFERLRHSFADVL